MYNLFFCKTKLKRKLWLQTVFRTKGRERQNEKVLIKLVCVCMCVLFPSFTIFCGSNRGLPLFCKEIRFWGPGFPLNNFIVVKWEVPDANHREMNRQLLRVYRTTWRSGCYHTDFHWRSQRLKQTDLSNVDPFTICFHCLQSCAFFWSAYLRVFEPECYGRQEENTDRNNDTFDKV